MMRAVSVVQLLVIAVSAPHISLFGGPSLNHIPIAFNSILAIERRLLEENKLKEASDVLIHLANHYGPRDMQLFNFAFTISRREFALEGMLLSNQVVFKFAKQAPDTGLMNISMFRAKLGDFLGGWPFYKKRIDNKVADDKPANRSGKPEWHGEPLAGKKILLLKEQCFGDLFQMLRLSKLLKDWGAYVILETYGCLKKFISYNKHLVDEVISNTDPVPEHDYYLYMMDLPMTAGVVGSIIGKHVPYLKNSDSIVKSWEEVLAGQEGLRIGLFWYGIKQVKDRGTSLQVNRRTIPTKELAPLFGTDKITFYSLQKGLEESEKSQLPEQENVMNFEGDFDGENGSFVDSHAVIKNMDLIVSIDSSIIHLAGALGVPAILLTPQQIDWRWMCNQKSVWYPSVTIMHQDRSYEWDTLLARVVAQLVLAANKRAKLNRRSME